MEQCATQSARTDSEASDLYVGKTVQMDSETMGPTVRNLDLTDEALAISERESVTTTTLRDAKNLVCYGTLNVRMDSTQWDAVYARLTDLMECRT